jgi:hypothetical protein
VFVADELPPELQRVIEFLNVQMNPAEVIGIEVRQYVGQGLKTLVRREWSWEEYEQEQGMAQDKLDTAKACFASIQKALTERALDWRPVFRQGYFGFVRPGTYHVVTVDLRPRMPLVSIKLPDPPERLGLQSPYPELEQTWDGAHRQWDWFIPSAMSVPDFGPAIDFSRPHQPESGPMRPSKETVAGTS